MILVPNATTRLEADLDRLGLTGAVDGVINTSRFGAAKPDPRVYHAAARHAGAHITECLFVDDDAANVEAARALGMTGLHYQEPRRLRDAIAPALESWG